VYCLTSFHFIQSSSAHGGFLVFFFFCVPLQSCSEPFTSFSSLVDCSHLDLHQSVAQIHFGLLIIQQKRACKFCGLKLTFS